MRLGLWVLAVVGQLGCSSRDRAQEATDLTLTALDTLVAAGGEQLSRPYELTVGSDGRIYVADAATSTIVVLDSVGRTVGTVGREGAGPGEFGVPRAVMATQDSIWVADPRNGRFQVLSARGEFARSYASPPSAAAGAIAFRKDGSAVVGLNGVEQALAVRVSPTGEEGGRLGRPVVAAPEVWDFAAMKAEIGRGLVPAAFRNSVTPVPAFDGGTWVVLNGEGGVQRYDARDSLMWASAIAEPEFASVRETFYRENNADSTRWRIRPLRYLATASEVGGTLWVLVHQAQGPVLILRVGESGRIEGRVRVPSAVGVGAFAVDAARGFLYLLGTEDATLLRLRLPKDVVAGTS